MYPSATCCSPRLSARAMLEGMSARGLAREPAHRRRGVRSRRARAKGRACSPQRPSSRLWASALARAGRETLPLEVGLAVPYGAFGALDFLAGTSDTVRSSLQSLASYFRTASPSFRLEIDEAAERRAGPASSAAVPRTCRPRERPASRSASCSGGFASSPTGPFRASLDVRRRRAGRRRGIPARRRDGPSLSAQDIRDRADPRLLRGSSSLRRSAPPRHACALADTLDLGSDRDGLRARAPGPPPDRAARGSRGRRVDGPRPRHVRADVAAQARRDGADLLGRPRRFPPRGGPAAARRSPPVSRCSSPRALASPSRARSTAPSSDGRGTRRRRFGEGPIGATRCADE